MTAAVGRALALEWDGTPVAGVREKSIALNGEPIDVTDDDDDGWRALLADEAAQNEVTISVNGVTKDDTLRAAWFGTRTSAMTVTFPDGGTISGNFFLQSYTETGAYNDAVTFEAEFQSSGIVTYTPPA